MISARWSLSPLPKACPPVLIAAAMFVPPRGMISVSSSCERASAPRRNRPSAAPAKCAAGKGDQPTRSPPSWPMRSCAASFARASRLGARSCRQHAREQSIAMSTSRPSACSAPTCSRARLREASRSRQAPRAAAGQTARRAASPTLTRAGEPILQAAPPRVSAGDERAPPAFVAGKKQRDEQRDREREPPKADWSAEREVMAVSSPTVCASTDLQREQRRSPPRQNHGNKSRYCLYAIQLDRRFLQLVDLLENLRSSVFVSVAR